ncbi:MAG TPA: DUF6448 family protein [Terrimicrobiaceae bacterium]
MTKTDSIFKALTMFAISFVTVLVVSGNVFAHCDGLDGPVVKAAREALETGNVNLVLIWVKKDDEAAIDKAFRQALAVRTLSAEAKDMADMYFFETLVRMHRAGEGAPYTGLKPAGRDLGPAIPAADKALEDGSIEPVVKLLTGLVQDGVRERFQRAMDQKNFNKDKVETGREYVETYVTFIHYVEGIYQAAQSPAHGHYEEPSLGHQHED